MNVLIVAVCLNIAFVNAYEDIDLNTVIKILKILVENRYVQCDTEFVLCVQNQGCHVNSIFFSCCATLWGRRTFLIPTIKQKAPIETIPMIPGFFMQKPAEISKPSFLNTWGKSSVLNPLDNRNKRQNKIKSGDLKMATRNEYLTEKILAAKENLKKNKESQKYDKNDKSISMNIVSRIAEKQLVQKLLANVFNGNENSKPSRGSENDRYDRTDTYEELDTIIKNTNYTLLVEQFLKEVWYRIKNKKDLQKGKRYAKIEERSWNSLSDKDDIKERLLKAFSDNNRLLKGKKRQQPSVILIETSPDVLLKPSHAANIKDPVDESQYNNDINEIENNANEIINDDDFFSNSDNDDSDLGFRRHTFRRSKSDKDSLDTTCEKVSDTESSSEPEDDEKNPGNPYTIHKNKYKQNWLWNHYMDGDHMNINPYAPKLGKLGPTGPELFFGRKWWYFNQDDYKPMG